MGTRIVKDKIKNISKVYSGATPSTNNDEYWNGDILWITPYDLSRLTSQYFDDTERKITNEGLKSCSTHLLPAGSLVMSSRAPIGYLSISKKEFTTNQGCKSLVFYEKYDPLYFYYNIQTHIDNLKRLGEGTTFAEISKNYLEEYELTFPESKTEQQKIASILNTTDTAIFQTEHLIAKYKRIHKGLMHDLLTFGIDAKGSVRNPQTHRFEIKNNLLVPIEWNVKQIIKTTYLKARIGWQGLKASEFQTEGPYLVTGTDFTDGEINWESCYHVSEERFLEAKYIHLLNGDLVITKDGTIGKTAMITNCPEKAVLNSGVFVMRCKDGSYLNKFMFYVLNSQIFKDFLFRTQGGSTIIHLYQREFEKFCFPCPQVDEQKKIIEILDNSENNIKNEASKLKKLIAIKKGLMNDLLTKHVEVKGVQ